MLSVGKVEERAIVASGVLIVLGGIMGVLVLYLYGYHLRLIVRNQTTHEVIKKRINEFGY